MYSYNSSVKAKINHRKHLPHIPSREFSPGRDTFFKALDTALNSEYFLRATWAKKKHLGSGVT